MATVELHCESNYFSESGALGPRVAALYSLLGQICKQL
jgi:hypothetical protein